MVSEPSSLLPGNIGPIGQLRFSPQHSRIRSVSAMSAAISEKLCLQNLKKHYVIGDELGEGSFGKVYKVKCVKTGKCFALKSVRRNEDNEERDLAAEVLMSSEFDHPYLLKLHAFFCEDGAYHLILELCQGGDLHGFLEWTVAAWAELIPGYASGLPTEIAARYFGMMLGGLTYLHYHGFIHRDIKPENYLLVTKSEASPIKLADFGFARIIARSQKLTHSVGTARYVAPEVLAGSYDQLADVWSLGVTCFAICTNSLPFSGKERADYIRNAQAGAIQNLPDAWASHMPDLKAIVYRMLTVDPQKRPPAKVLLSENLWLTKYAKNAVPKGMCSCGFN